MLSWVKLVCIICKRANNKRAQQVTALEPFVTRLHTILVWSAKLIIKS